MVGYVWPKVGCINFDRLKQAWWDAFHGTAQPLFRESGATGPGPFVRIFVDEVGYQARIAPDKTGLYDGSENVPLVDEATQGSYYAQLIALMACDPDVALLNFFHAVDERSLAAWQSGILLPDGTRRASYATVKGAIAQNGQCHGELESWRHAESVVGAYADFRGLRSSFVVKANEGFTFNVGVLRGAKRVTGAAGTGQENTGTLFKLPRLARGSYRVVVKLAAETNARRTATFSRSFRVP
jgi:hypothetical protein